MFVCLGGIAFALFAALAGGVLAVELLDLLVAKMLPRYWGLVATVFLTLIGVTLVLQAKKAFGWLISVALGLVVLVLVLYSFVGVQKATIARIQNAGSMGILCCIWDGLRGWYLLLTGA